MRSLSSLVILTVALCGSLSHATRVVKSYDGQLKFCPPKAEAVKSYSDKGLIIDLRSVSGSQNEEDLSLAVSVVKCENGVWVNDPNPNFESYVAPNGKRIEVLYDKYRFYLTNQKGEVLLQTELSALNAKLPVADVQMSIDKTKDKSQVFELTVTVDKTYRSSDGVELSQTEHFGVYNLLPN